MKPTARALSFTAALTFLGLLAGLPACRAAGEDRLAAQPEPVLAAEIARAKAQAGKDDQPEIARAEQDLQAGRRWLAVQRLAGVEENVAVGAWLARRPAAERKDMAAFEAEWKRMGEVLRADLGPASASGSVGLADVEPAVLRALAEAARPQIRGYYQSSLDYGHNTMAEQGFYYLAAAQAQKDLIALYRSLSSPSGLAAPPVRALGPELDSLEADLLAAYRPPASIDRHGQFIGASSTLKEARELDAAGLRYGALLRYLQAARQVAALTGTVQPLSADELSGRLREVDTRLSAGGMGGVDHSLGRLFLEAAQSETDPAAAGLVVVDVLPRYFAALQPARPEPPRPAPQVTVTLVRWPYT